MTCEPTTLLLVCRYHVLKMFTPFGKIKREEFLWHTYGPKRGEPRGYAFVEYTTREVSTSLRFTSYISSQHTQKFNRMLAS